MCLVLPEAWCVLHGFISIWGEFLDKLFECDDARLFEIAHYAEDFEVDMPISFGMKDIFIYDLFWDHSVVNLDEMEIKHGCAEVEVLDVKYKVAGSIFGI